MTGGVAHRRCGSYRVVSEFSCVDMSCARSELLLCLSCCVFVCVVFV